LEERVGFSELVEAVSCCYGAEVGFAVELDGLRLTVGGGGLWVGGDERGESVGFGDAELAEEEVYVGAVAVEVEGEVGVLGRGRGGEEG
jgi:hypothetical protein